MIQYIIVIGFVLLAGIFLIKKMYNTFTKPMDKCSQCSQSCKSIDECNM